jgi:hypothetical protein
VSTSKANGHDSNATLLKMAGTHSMRICHKARYCGQYIVADQYNVTLHTIEIIILLFKLYKTYEFIPVFVVGFVLFNLKYSVECSLNNIILNFQYAIIVLLLLIAQIAAVAWFVGLTSSVSKSDNTF